MKARNKMNIQTIQASIDALGAEYNTKVLPLRQALEVEFNAVFDADAELQENLKALDSSTEYAFDEIGELISWARLDRTLLERYKSIDEALDQLERYVSDHGFSLDLKNECITSFQGGYIGIDAETGDIWSNDCGHTESIASGSAYETVEERNALIEAYMERTGVYPTVVKVGRYGDATLVNTQATKAKA